MVDTRVTLIEAVLAVARADESHWERFRQLAGRLTHYETDYAAERLVRDWFYPHLRNRAIDGWVQQFILDLFTEAAATRCRVTGIIGLKEVEVPPAIFKSTRLVHDLFVDGKGFYENEIRLPDSTLVVGVSVSWIERIGRRRGPQEQEPRIEPEADPSLPPTGKRSATAAELQTAYDARVTKEYAPTLEEDLKWAADQQITQDRVAELRRINKDPRLHKRGRRS